ncbi:MAG: MFS transporter [Desulfohalobiaceae bacterium]|nr:MFS transporter [Desulfohalobiaceae bacterium]
MDRRILLTLLLAVFIALIGIGIIAPVMPLYATELGATGLSLGLIVAGFSLSRGLVQPLVGGYADRYGKKRFLVCGLLVYAVVGTLFTSAETVGHLILIRILHGIGSAMIVPIAMAYIGEMAPRGQEGKYMGQLNIALFSGIGGGPVIGGVFLDIWGMNSAFYAMAALSGLSLGLVLFFLPPKNSDQQSESRESLPATFLAMSRSIRVMGILLSRMATMLIMVPTMAFLPLLMTEFMEASGTRIGIVVASRTLINAVLQTPFGRWVDTGRKANLLLAGSCLISLTMFLVPLAGGFPQLVFLFMFMGVGEAVVWPALGAMAAEEGRTFGQGAMMGVFNLAMSVGVFFGALGAGMMMDLFGLAWVFYLIAVFLLITSLLAKAMIGGGPRAVDGLKT